MGILDELSSATGDKSSNKELVKQCLRMPALLHSIAEGLRTGAPKARVDCAEVLSEAAALRPDLLADFVTDFLDASKSDNKTVAKLGFLGLTRISMARAAEVYAEREYLLEAAKKNDVLGLAAAAVLAALCGNNPNYRGKLIGSVVRLLIAIPDKDLPKWIATLGPAVEGSPDAYKRLELTLQPRRATLAPEIVAKLDKALVKLERTTAKK
jgi:hypothetical protein